jgi:hypothetical protein
LVAAGRNSSCIFPAASGSDLRIPIPESAGEALAEFVKGMWTEFPDFHVELLNCGEIEQELVAVHWLLRGTNTGQRREGPATGRRVLIKGASIIRLKDDKIALDQCNFDRGAFDERLAGERLKQDTIMITLRCSRRLCGA